MSEMRSLTLKALKLDKRVSYRLARHLNALSIVLAYSQENLDIPGAIDSR